MPGHAQSALEIGRVALVGCGGLGSWIGLALARLGIRDLTVFDGDSFDRTNAPRQFMFGRDIGQAKAVRLATNLRQHMTNAGRIEAVAKMCGLEELVAFGPFDVVIAGVDNNRARLEVSAYGLRYETPVVFAMLSQDGLRTRAFLQRPGQACLTCVLPDLDAERRAPCAAASIASCFLAAAHAVELTVAALSGIPGIPTWRETSLDGTTERTSDPAKRGSCTGCTWTGGLRRD